MFYDKEEESREKKLTQIRHVLGTDDRLRSTDSISIIGGLRTQMIQLIEDNFMLDGPGDAVDARDVSLTSLPDSVKNFFGALQKAGFQLYVYPHFTKTAEHVPIIEITARKKFHREGGFSVSVDNNLAVTIDAFYAGQNESLKYDVEYWRSGKIYNMYGPSVLVGGVLDVAINAAMKKLNPSTTVAK